MMTAEQTELQMQYIVQLRRALKDSPQLRRRLPLSVLDSIGEYLAAHPNATMQDLYSQFGTPQQVADEALQAAEPQERKTRQRRTRIILLCMAVALAVTTIIAVYFIATGGVHVITTEVTYTYYSSSPDISDEELAQSIVEQHIKEHMNDGK